MLRNAASSTCYIYDGTIIGGLTTANGGFITNAGSLNIYENSTIKNGKAVNGGNIYNTGTMRIYGKLTDGVASEKGGNLYSNGSNTWAYSRIGEGEAVQGGNIYYAEDGLYLFGAEIRNAVGGGGIYAAANFTVGGTAKTIANKMADATVNVYLAEDFTITAGTENTPFINVVKVPSGYAYDGTVVSFNENNTVTITVPDESPPNEKTVSCQNQNSDD